MIYFLFYLFTSLITFTKCDTCDSALNNFSSAVANFSQCAIASARPITLCEMCVENFIELLDGYRNLSEFSENGIKCIDNYVNLDRLQILETVYRSNYNLWHQAKCNECFKFSNNRLTPEPSNETLKFNELLDDWENCTYKVNKKNPKLLCPTCIDKYTILNEYYVSISDENEKIGVCMDIVDQMNTTRRYWSAYCCEYRKHKEYIFLGTTMVIFFVTILFYLLTRVFGEKQVPAILQQSRFAESLNHVNKTPHSDSDSDT